MKEDGRRLTKQQQVEARRRAMLLIGKGWRKNEIAEAMGVHPRTVQQWKQCQREHGTEALLRDERGRKLGEKRLMSEVQDQEVRKLIADHLPGQLELPFALWTRQAVAQLLEKRFELKLPLRTLGLYLQRWGIIPRKPYEQGSKEVTNWLKRKYPRIAARAKAEGAEILWGDRIEVKHPLHAVSVGSPDGETPDLHPMSGSLSCSMMSAVSNRGSARWMIYQGALNAQQIIHFLEQLVRSMQGRKVHLILDNQGEYHSQPVKEWLEKHGRQIVVHYLSSRRTGQHPATGNEADSIPLLAITS